MPRGRSALHFGGAALEDGVYAVVEWATYDDPETTDKMTDLFVPLTHWMLVSPMPKVRLPNEPSILQMWRHLFEPVLSSRMLA